MTISRDAEKSLKKIQHWFVIKNSQQTKNKIELLQHDKKYAHTHTCAHTHKWKIPKQRQKIMANIILKIERSKVSP